MAADAGSGERRHIPTWNGDDAKWESFRDEIQVWRLGENLNVKCSLAARLFSGLSGPARMTCMTMDADQLHRPTGDGPVATADERRNTAGHHNVMNVLQMSPSIEPGRHSRRTELSVWCPGFPDDTLPLDTISAELNRVFASVHMSESVSSTPAIPPGRACSSNERERVPRSLRPHHRWGPSRPTFAAERTQNHSASSAQWDTFEEIDTEEEDNDGSDTIDPGDLQEHVRDDLEGDNDAPIPGVDNSQLESACLKFSELTEALAIVQAARRGASDQNRHSRGSPVDKGKTRQSFGRQRVPNSACDQRQNDDKPQQRRGMDLQAKLDKRKAHSVCHACGQTGHLAGDPQCPRSSCQRDRARG